MKHIFAEDDRMFEEYSKHKVRCKHCGHNSTIPVYVDKRICSWCGNYVFRTPEIEFKFRLDQEIKKRKRVQNDVNKTN